MTKRDITQQEKPSALKQLREDAGLTQEQVAYRLKKAVSTIRRWEKGDEPSLTRREWSELCLLIGKKFDELPEVMSTPLVENEID
ncbi:helix-turn-helix domain-containing protein [Plectonema cf. radiosum LEGE 06105]|uniref:Helix-turn-helix domain-containing protein n=1 Tax=Plectonema cf. radiosum LEGE 06105 TaxID=945769 RepID=A0A8J7F7Y7_9CYAN|nr:helix-turn-helix transcriptional regulator [Plectonema radiosum]MBE9213729.1 helix-turn-helix domain-containing protein [Plectonema cf. radiosum LEGE 06105]